MTEEEWLACTDFLAMLIHLRGEVEVPPGELGFGLHCHAGFLAHGEAERTSSRKLRLFGAAVCRRWWELPLDERSSRLVSAYQRYATDSTTWDEVIKCGEALGKPEDREQIGISQMAVVQPDTPYGAQAMAFDLAWAVANHVASDSMAVTCKDATDEDRWDWGWGLGPPDPLWQATRKAIEDEFALLLREIIGNPFRAPPRMIPSWLAWEGGTVVNIARGIYNEEAFDRMPFLADALEEAGCDNAEVLTHLRLPGPHVRGCWPLDLILGKE
jgi:hypothetical protein